MRSKYLCISKENERFLTQLAINFGGIDVGTPFSISDRKLVAALHT